VSAKDVPESRLLGTLGAVLGEILKRNEGEVCNASGVSPNFARMSQNVDKAPPAGPPLGPQIILSRSAPACQRAYGAANPARFRNSPAPLRPVKHPSRATILPREITAATAPLSVRPS
jgi:hypothetical protein